MELKATMPAGLAGPSTMNGIHYMELKATTVLAGKNLKWTNPLHGVERVGNPPNFDVPLSTNPLHGVERRKGSQWESLTWI